jgi:hypothetical protein
VGILHLANWVITLHQIRPAQDIAQGLQPRQRQLHGIDCILRLRVKHTRAIKRHMG